MDAITDDPGDNRVIECTVEAGAEAVITGDDHLLDLGCYSGIVLLRLHEACARWGI